MLRPKFVKLFGFYLHIYLCFALARARNIGDRKYLINGAAPIVARAQIDWPCELHKFVAHDVNDADSICARNVAKYQPSIAGALRASVQRQLKH